MTERTLKGKNVLIAGGGKNLGGLVARQSAAAGANVVIHYNSDSSRDEAETTLSAVEAEGVQGAVSAIADVVGQAAAKAIDRAAAAATPGDKAG